VVPTIGVVTSLGQPNMQNALSHFCHGIFEQPRLYVRHSDRSNRLAQETAAITRRRQLEALAKYYCHGRLPDSFKASMSSTDQFGSPKTAFVLDQRPRMILFPVSTEIGIWDRLHLYQSVVNGQDFGPIDILHHIFPPVALQDERLLKHAIRTRNFTLPIQALPDQDQVILGSLIMELDKKEGEFACMLGYHTKNHHLQVINDVLDYSRSSGRTRKVMSRLTSLNSPGCI